MYKWKFAKVTNHIFTYDKANGHLTCVCGFLNLHIDERQIIDTSKRHVRNLTRWRGKMELQDLSQVR